MTCVDLPCVVLCCILLTACVCRRFTGVPDEDVSAVQWMVSQERLASKVKQQEKASDMRHTCHMDCSWGVMTT